jgi:hypothetical protein
VIMRGAGPPAFSEFCAGRSCPGSARPEAISGHPRFAQPQLLYGCPGPASPQGVTLACCGGQRIACSSGGTDGPTAGPPSVMRQTVRPALIQVPGVEG